ncbi:hypothetical protein ALI22I_13590 [Saccharothrix sp. ALI-22-I]|uniref:hypothetical protein n=1 Tax=Saccharothrix sp. ALI-22-I TaxID=1933778 RepID=UPI00097C4B8E|nr:hypothetical protein [Saccharothrix sp. ALI-22-I]ONI89954.1 hypothetical protein ALI22I_13590 [Saccharothrix sp. ALI-22-I]
MAKAVAVEPDRLDQEAREAFRQLTPAPVTGRDENGRPGAITPGERLVEITRRSRIIAVSDTLARAVVALLAQRGVASEIGHVHVDPAESDEQVLGLLVVLDGKRAVVPIRPGARQLRAYPEAGAIDLTGNDPLLVIDLPADAIEQDGWLGAVAITTALTGHLAPPA